MSSGNCRPPVGFIVEGLGEYHCYPSLFNRVNNITGCLVPTTYTGGCGTLFKRLPEYLTDLCRTKLPQNVIVTVDLVDLLNQELANSCRDAIDKLNTEIQTWRESAATDTRLTFLPDQIVVVLQIQKFESWLISDTEGLKLQELVDPETDIVTDSDSVRNPQKWLDDNLVDPGSAKSPKFAKKIVSAIRPSQMRENSSSFDKFFRECTRLYNSTV